MKSLKEWRVTSALPAGFEQSVWRRIEQAQARRPGIFEAWRAWLEGAFARRSVALGYAALVVAAGLLAGYERGRATERQWSEQLAARYTQTVDPELNIPTK